MQCFDPTGRSPRHCERGSLQRLRRLCALRGACRPLHGCFAIARSVVLRPEDPQGAPTSGGVAGRRAYRSWDPLLATTNCECSVECNNGDKSRAWAALTDEREP